MSGPAHRHSVVTAALAVVMSDDWSLAARYSHRVPEHVYLLTAFAS